MLYANYVRNKMRHLYKTIFSSGYPLKIISKFNKKAVDYTIHGKTESENGVGDLDSESGKYKITLANAGKNLIIYPYAIDMSATRSGVTFTDNGYGIVTANGTATANISLLLNRTNITLENGTYTLSGCPEGGGTNTYKVYSALYKGTVTGAKDNISDIGSGATIDTNLTGYNAMRMYIRIMKGTVCNNLVFKPMLCKSETATEYAPYREPYTADIYLTAPLKNGESISYKADSLPELQLHKGENNIYVDTEVKPSAIDVKYLN